MSGVDRVQKIRETATRIQTHLQAVRGTESPIDHERMYYAISMALLSLVGELEEIRRELGRQDAERKYLQRRGWS